jgi:hypothetical protein
VRARFRLRGAPALSLRARSDSVGVEAHRFRTSREATVSAHAGISETFLGPGRSVSGRDGLLGFEESATGVPVGCAVVVPPADLFCPRRCSGRGEAGGSWRPSSVGGPGLGEQAGQRAAAPPSLAARGAGWDNRGAMAQALGYLLAVLLIGYIAYAVWTGAWYGTWCASGRKPGQRIPGVRPPEPR